MNRTYKVVEKETEGFTHTQIIRPFVFFFFAKSTINTKNASGYTDTIRVPQ